MQRDFISICLMIKYCNILHHYIEWKQERSTRNSMYQKLFLLMDIIQLQVL